ncbi:hypothetical protein [Parasulfitobacter algicola]|uniref:Uncharacterized protein n=1 Tax=Parasulfitobacter algicola TaxID=2614809 RepID=A0ABX2J0E3_9RHOB|nr:hypothetical protein [Sulfitobacter algicola]NSX56518.1 hypothetical protein [Sulfitobacter algicola]
MDTLLELVIGFTAIAIYGTEGKPRHPIWRNSLRTVVFAGFVIAFVDLQFPTLSLEIPIAIELLWLFGFVTVLLAEFYVGSIYIALATCLLP